MTKVILMSHKIMDMIHGQPVTLELMFQAIHALNASFQNAIANMKEIGTYHSFDTSKVGLCANGNYSTHKLIRQHDCLSICQSSTPIKALVLDQQHTPFLGDKEMQSLLLVLLAFYNVDLDKMYNMTKDELKMRFRAQSKQVEFGPKTCTKWWNFLDEARLVKHKLAGSPNWIHLPIGHQDQQTGLGAIPIPVYDAPDIPAITGMVDTTEGSSPGGDTTQSDPWRNGQDPWSQWCSK